MTCIAQTADTLHQQIVTGNMHRIYYVGPHVGSAGAGRANMAGIAEAGIKATHYKSPGG